MSLSDQTKDQLQLLVDLNEPEALLATIARACRRTAQAPMSIELAQRWSNVANALFEAEAAVTALQSPERAKLEAHTAEWPVNEDKPADAAETAETSPTGAGEDRPIAT
jgi:hypothetical protein